MAGRFPLRSLLRDILMMLCGSVLGLLLAKGFVSHDLRALDISHLCNAVQMSKKVIKSEQEQPFVWVGSGRGHKGQSSEGQGVKGHLDGGKRGVRVTRGSRSYGDYSGSGMTQRTHPQGKAASVGSLLVGVVMEHHRLHRTIKSVMDTWGQRSNNLTFFSIGGEKEWAWDKRRGYAKNTASVVRVNYSTTEAISKTSGGIVSALQYMYKSQINTFDWFLCVPHDVSVRLDDVTALLGELDPLRPLFLGRPGDQDGVGSSGSGGGGSGVRQCDVGRGVVMSRRLLWELGGVEGVCGLGERWPWDCLQHVSVDCSHQNQVFIEL